MKFESFKNARIVRSSWLEEGGRRLDCNPYMSGALETRERLSQLDIKKDLLETVVVPRGIYKGKLLKRTFVSSSDKGILFLTTSGMMQADPSSESYLAKFIAAKDTGCLVKKGMILVSAAGTIGRMIYCGRLHVGTFACSDILKIVADENRIRSGYLYAFLASRYGLPLVVSGTYGAMIPHINEEHVTHIPIPRLADKIEAHIGNLIDEAAESRAKASELLRVGVDRFLKLVNLPDISQSPLPTGFSVSIAMSSELTRLDATFFSRNGRDPAETLEAQSNNPRRLSDCAKIFTPGIFKRMHVSDPKWGYAYYSGSELFEYFPTPRGYLSRVAPKIDDYLIRKDWLLIQDAGQIGGLIGHVTRAGAIVDNSVVSNHIMRVAADSREDSAYLFAVLSSSYGYRAILRNAFGSSIPQLDAKHIGGMQVPWLDADKRRFVSAPILEAWDLIDFAESAERRGISLIEDAIGEGGV